MSKLKFQPAPAPLHHRTTPSSPPVTNAPGLPSAGNLGRQATAQTSPVSCTVETAERAAISQTLIVLSADLKDMEHISINEGHAETCITPKERVGHLETYQYSGPRTSAPRKWQRLPLEQSEHHVTRGAYLLKHLTTTGNIYLSIFFARNK